MQNNRINNESPSCDNLMATDDSEPDFVDAPTNDVVPSFSFSGCGFLGVYHVGVAACLRDHTDVVNRPEIKFAGASAGALVATTFLCGMNFGEMARLLLDIANAVREKEDIDLGGQLKDLLNEYLPDDAHAKLRNRLYISMTVINGLECGLVTNFESKDHLIQCLIATCFVPGFLGWIPPSIEADSFMETGTGFPELGEREKSKKEKLMKQEEDGDCRTRTEKLNPEGGATRAESVWDVYSDSDETPVDKFAHIDNSYLKMLVQLCYKSLSTTTHVMRQIPVASHLLESVIPMGMNGLDEFVEAIALEVLSNKYMAFDGGFSDNIPSFDSNTITVCPFAGESDICPHDLTALDISFDLGNTSMQASEDNIFRLTHALNPMEPKMLYKLCEQGYNECLRFLEKKDLLSCKKHLMTRATLSSSPCNIGHAHCKCQICQATDPKIRISLSCVSCQKTKKKALESNLPKDVQREFQRAIDNYTKNSQDTFWTRVLSVLWWCTERMYSGTICLADLCVKFHMWLMRFWDNLTCIAKYTVLPLGQKRKLIRCILSSLQKTITASIQSNSPIACPLNNLQSIRP